MLEQSRPVRLGCAKQTPNATSNGGDASRVGIFSAASFLWKRCSYCLVKFVFFSPFSIPTRDASPPLVFESVRIFTFHRIAIHSEYNCANCLHSTLFVIKTLIIRGLWSVDTIYTYLHLSALCLHSSTLVCTSAFLHLLFDVFVGIDILTNGFSQWRCTLMRGRHFCCSERKSALPMPGCVTGVTV